jgi:hypothetical protein
MDICVFCAAMGFTTMGCPVLMVFQQDSDIQTLAIEADTAISLLNPHEQAYMRQTVTQKLHKLINNTKTQKGKT